MPNLRVFLAIFLPVRCQGRLSLFRSSHLAERDVRVGFRPDFIPQITLGAGVGASRSPDSLAN
ncbi:hypothetical protein AO501_24655 [Mycobacterium gordonae]|uniref:Uncharacterized protein n=1 Tax=Mycobacterium gordonae TaxID=1778 RepID=A0A0Q2QTR5_MYCGO|nr:hypothetical protein AO501_24655 [Mycobacterium gordonae]